VRRLLDHRPAIRMSLTDALKHPWLKAYVPIYPNLHHPRTPSAPSNSHPLVAEDSTLSEFLDDGGSFVNLDESTDAGVSQGFEHLKINQSLAPEDSAAAIVSNIPGAYPSSNNRESSRLQRRSQVLSQAADGGEGPVVPEPSWEMLQNVTSSAKGNRNVANDSATTADNGRTNKRVHSELTPLPEEYESSDKSSPLGDANASRKKGKASDEDSPGTASRVAGNKSKKGANKRKRRASTGTSSRATGGRKEDAMSDGDDGPSGSNVGGDVPKLRRSLRQTPKKVARHS
jgi:hypothetical protein